MYKPIEHLAGQTIFGQTNLSYIFSYIISGEVNEFTKEKANVPTIVSPYHIYGIIYIGYKE